MKFGIRFEGGALHGKTIETNDARRITRQLIAQTGRWFKQTPEGDVAVMLYGVKSIAKTPRLDKDWVAIETNVYAKTEQKDERGYFVYTYVRAEILDRCRQVTLAGQRCMHPVYKSPYVCKVHKGQITSVPVEDGVPESPRVGRR